MPARKCASFAYHGFFLAARPLVVVFLSKQIATPINHGIHVLAGPVKGLGAFSYRSWCCLRNR